MVIMTVESAESTMMAIILTEIIMMAIIMMAIAQNTTTN
jgi:hypothetical protein